MRNLFLTGFLVSSMGLSNPLEARTNCGEALQQVRDAGLLSSTEWDTLLHQSVVGKQLTDEAFDILSTLHSSRALRPGVFARMLNIGMTPFEKVLYATNLAVPWNNELKRRRAMQQEMNLQVQKYFKNLKNDPDVMIVQFLIPQISPKKHLARELSTQQIRVIKNAYANLYKPKKNYDYHVITALADYFEVSYARMQALIFSGPSF